MGAGDGDRFFSASFGAFDSGMLLENEVAGLLGEETMI